MIVDYHPPNNPYKHISYIDIYILIYDDKSMTPEELTKAIKANKEELDRLYRLRDSMILEAYAAGVSVSRIANKLDMKQPNVSAIIRGGQRA